MAIRKVGPLWFRAVGEWRELREGEAPAEPSRAEWVKVRQEPRPP